MSASTSHKCSGSAADNSYEDAPSSRRPNSGAPSAATSSREPQVNQTVYVFVVVQEKLEQDGGKEAEILGVYLSRVDAHNATNEMMGFSEMLMMEVKKMNLLNELGCLLRLKMWLCSPCVWRSKSFYDRVEQKLSNRYHRPRLIRKRGLWSLKVTQMVKSWNAKDNLEGGRNG